MFAPASAGTRNCVTRCRLCHLAISGEVPAVGSVASGAVQLSYAKLTRMISRRKLLAAGGGRVLAVLGAGLGHALPYLIPHFWTATVIAAAVVFVELWAIAFIQNRYMETPFLRAAFQVVLGGALVFAAGVLIGNA